MPVFRFQVKNDRELGIFESLGSDYDIWKEPRHFGDHADVHIPRAHADLFEMKLISNRVDYDIMIEDVEAVVDEVFRSAAPEYTTFADFDYEKYHRYADYQQWQADFAAANSDIVSIDNYGQTFEGMQSFLSPNFNPLSF